MNKIQKIYKILLKEYGPQGWWPLLDCKGVNPTKTGVVRGYHPGDYSYPKDKSQRFEICIGAILTQNTAWSNVEKALHNLKKSDALTIEGIDRLSEGKLRECIKVSGYFNQKAKYIRAFVQFFKTLQHVPSRDELLDVKGIGPETADSMLLYAFHVPTFVVDAYTRRIFVNLSLIDHKMSYDKVKAMFENALPQDSKIFQEYHALLVEHAKRFYTKKPYDDTLLKVIR